VRTDVDLFAHIWPDRASLPLAPIYEHDAAFASAPRSSKLAQVRAAMAGHGASHHFISTVDDIAWLFNLRGSDVSYNPVFLAHALVNATSASLFVANGKVPAALVARLKEDGVTVQDYPLASPALAALPTDAVLLMDPRRVTLGLRESAPASVKVVEAINPSVLAQEPQGRGRSRPRARRDGARRCGHVRVLCLV
jgi:Xaa-Pro aminopeptidase